MMRWPAFAWAIIGVGVGLAWTALGPACPRARAQSVAVLAISNDHDERVATDFNRALRAEVADDPSWTLSDSRASLSQMTMAQDCDVTDAACQGRIGNALHVDLVIYGTLERAGASYEAELHMFATAGGPQRVARRALPSDETSGKQLRRHARALLQELRDQPAAEEGAGPPPVATVAADVAPLPPSAVDTSEPPAHVARSSDDWIGYTLLGVAGVSVGLTVFSWAQIHSAGKDESLTAYRKAVGTSNPDANDACDEADKGIRYGVSAATVAAARDACGRGKTFEALQYVFLGVAVVSGGVGAYFLLNDEKGHSADRPIAFQPSFGPHGAGLRVRLRL